MGRVLAAAGRFDANWLISTALSCSNLTGGKGVPVTAWGVSYCYGNQLETLRVHRPREVEKEVARLAEIRTDMLIFYLHDQHEILSSYVVQPLVRRKGDLNWAFCRIGRLEHFEPLFQTTLYPEAVDPSELFFVQLLDHFTRDQPIESVQTILSQISDGPDLSFAMMCPEMLVVAHWTTEGDADELKLFLGKGELLRIFTTFPRMEIPGVEWTEVANHSVTVMFRKRRVVV